MMHFPLVLSIAVLCLLHPVPVQADPCLDRIAALYDGGALDSRVRPPHRNTKVVTGPQGDPLRTFRSIVETPLRTVSGIEGEGPFALVIDRRSWTGPGLDGPWTEAPNHFPEDRAARIDRTLRQEQANLTDTACPGMTEIGGQRLEEFRFTTQTDPDPDLGGTWFGARSTVFVDPETDRLMLWRMTDFRSSWSDGVNPEVHETTFDYDLSIRLAAPD